MLCFVNFFDRVEKNGVAGKHASTSARGLDFKGVGDDAVSGNKAEKLSFEKRRDVSGELGRIFQQKAREKFKRLIRVEATRN